MKGGLLLLGFSDLVVVDSPERRATIWGAHSVVGSVQCRYADRESICKFSLRVGDYGC